MCLSRLKGCRRPHHLDNDATITAIRWPADVRPLGAAQGAADLSCRPASLVASKHPCWSEQQSSPTLSVPRRPNEAADRTQGHAAGTIRKRAGHEFQTRFGRRPRPGRATPGGSDDDDGTLRSMSHGGAEPIVLNLTVEDVMTLRSGLRRYLLYWRSHVEEAGGAEHSDEQYAEIRRRVGELIWRLERATASTGCRVQHSDEAVRPPGVDALLDRHLSDWAEQGPSPHPWDGHGFSVERQRPDGRWVSGWTQATQETVAWRGMCFCGWRGDEISGDFATGQEDDDARERAYDWWNEHHVPGFKQRNRDDAE